ncbi:hypothetical protein PAPYR_12154 [Paratrimastix pyriformis]|uniref:Uncharacterized protein n=1 Tax=Paratrimastix pyriformis TaxID=342808 RepID=A0ABQ8U2B4_9EUKA|nr:hypothetical protein PAPYR_12154 [Paratrimastix pyriformis]
MVVIDGGHFIFSAIFVRAPWLYCCLFTHNLIDKMFGEHPEVAIDTSLSCSLSFGTRRLHGKVAPPLHRRRSATGDEEAASTGREPSWDLRGKVPVAAPSCSAFLDVPLARAMPDNESSRCFTCTPGVATRLRRCLGFAWLIMNLSSFSLKPSGAVTPSWIVYCVARY